jgi:valyl-tRNA synthetase
LVAKPESLARPLNVFVVNSCKFYVPLRDLVDLDKIKSGISSKIAKLDKDILGLESRLHSPNFIQNASKEKIQETKSGLDLLLAQKHTYLAEIEALS